MLASNILLICEKQLSVVSGVTISLF